MLVKSEGIVLQNIKYGDKKSILKVFTKQHGLLTFYAVAGKAPSSKIKTASLLPLTQIELSFTFKQNRDVQQLIESNIIYVYEGISRDYNKLAIAQFLNEILIKSIKEQHPNEELYFFVTGVYKLLNELKSGFSNIHIDFIIELSKFLGFEPHNNFSETNCYFDTREGRFSSMGMSYPLGFSKEQSKLFSKVLSGGAISSPINKHERNEALECLLALYKMHVAGFNDLKSFEVLKELFKQD